MVTNKPHEPSVVVYFPWLPCPLLTQRYDIDKLWSTEPQAYSRDYMAKVSNSNNVELRGTPTLNKKNGTIALAKQL